VFLRIYGVFSAITGVLHISKVMYCISRGGFERYRSIEKSIRSTELSAFSCVIEGQLEAVVRAKSPGTIEKISFKLGDELMQGQVLVSLNDDIAQLNQARDTLNSMQIPALIRGRAASKNTNLVISDSLQTGQEIARIVDLGNLRVRLSLGQDQVFLVCEGCRAEISIETPGETYRADGVVKAVSAGSDLRTGSWTALVDFTNPASDLLKAGMIADVTIINEDAPLYTVVPGDAVAYRDGKTWIYVVENGMVNRQEITIADRFGNLTAVNIPDGSPDLLGKSVLVSGLSKAQGGDRAAVDSAERSSQ